MVGEAGIFRAWAEISRGAGESGFWGLLAMSYVGV